MSSYCGGSRVQIFPTSTTSVQRGSAPPHCSSFSHSIEHSSASSGPSRHTELTQSLPSSQDSPSSPVPRAPGAQKQPSSSVHSHRWLSGHSRLKAQSAPPSAVGCASSPASMDPSAVVLESSMPPSAEPPSADPSNAASPSVEASSSPHADANRKDRQKIGQTILCISPS